MLEFVRQCISAFRIQRKNYFWPKILFPAKLSSSVRVEIPPKKHGEKQSVFQDTTAGYASKNA